MSTWEKVKQDVIHEQEKLTRWKKQKDEADIIAAGAPELIAFKTEAFGDTSNSLSALIEAKGSSAHYAEGVARSFFTSYEKLVDGVILIRESFGERQAPTIVSACGLSAVLKKRFERSDLGQLLSQARLTSKVVDLGPMSLKKFGLEGLLSQSTARHIVIAPILHKRKALGYLLVLTPQPLPQSVLAHLGKCLLPQRWYLFWFPVERGSGGAKVDRSL